MGLNWKTTGNNQSGMKQYKNYLDQFMRSFKYAEDVQAEIFSALERTYTRIENREKLEKIRAEYAQDSSMDFSKVIRFSDELSLQTGVNGYTMYALTLILLAEISKKHYALNGISQEMWKQNFLDLSYKIEECKLVKGVVGVFCPDWYGRFFAVTRFSFGKLQFEKDIFPYDYCKNGVELSDGDTVVNVHIPRTGGRLTPQDVEYACAEASKFFKAKYLLNRIVFVCHSWLLYPENKKMLSVDSNLYSFIDRFDVIKWEEDRQYRDAWRLFDMEYKGDANALPQNTSLRKAYAQRIKSGQPTGWGYGVWVYEA